MIKINLHAFTFFEIVQVKERLSQNHKTCTCEKPKKTAIQTQYRQLNVFIIGIADHTLYLTLLLEGGLFALFITSSLTEAKLAGEP